MKYQQPTITDHGSIAEHTFSRCPEGTGTFPPKDTQSCELDKFGECSCGS